MKIADFEKLSEMGLIWKINKEILHPLGLALSRDGKISRGAMIANDGAWEYPPDVDIRNSAKYNTTLSLHNAGKLLSKIS